jgi:N6-L-threonylcarbamoyladenine synthase
MNSKPIYILSIESSCDDTSIAILKDKQVLSNVIANQDIHTKYGGVVPELASRAHDQNISMTYEAALDKAGITAQDLNAIAFTNGPGLLGSLLVGSSFAKGLSLGLDIPLISVNHMKAHILAHFIEGQATPKFPFLCLTVSGGHTQIVMVKAIDEMEIIGQTQDDAAGEAFDKSAKMLGIEYPGGPLIDKYAQNGDPLKFPFPKAKMPNYDYSFSGLKTAILNFINKNRRKNERFIEDNMNDLCASIQHTIVETLFDKLIRASDDLGIKQIAIAGGVSANSQIRKRLSELKTLKNWDVYIPEFQYCTDNAAMIGISGYFEYQKEKFASLKLSPQPRLKINVDS